MPLPTTLPGKNTALAVTAGPVPCRTGLLRLLPPSTLLLRLLLPPSMLLLRRPLVLPVPLSRTGLLRHSNARDLSPKALSEDHRLLAVADVAASSEVDRRCSRRIDAVLLLLPLLPWPTGLSTLPKLAVVCNLGRPTGWVDGICSLALTLVVRIACARIMWGWVGLARELLLLLCRTSSASTMPTWAVVSRP